MIRLGNSVRFTPNEVEEFREVGLDLGDVKCQNDIEQEVSRWAHTLADERFELLEKIARSQCPLGCTAAHEALSIAPATLSHHIKELQTSGLIDVRREGKFAFLSIKPGVLEALSSYLQSLSPTASPRG